MTAHRMRFPDEMRFFVSNIFSIINGIKERIEIKERIIRMKYFLQKTKTKNTKK